MGRGKKITNEECITRLIQIHGNKYDYSKVKYKNNSVKVCIICPIHGDFWQTPSQRHSKKLKSCRTPYGLKLISS